jgi:hypothetical protein
MLREAIRWRRESKSLGTTAAAAADGELLPEEALRVPPTWKAAMRQSDTSPLESTTARLA